ncbi:MAG TPA: LysR family transcriptional regulator [Syntrophales bacterium]|mgnify:CR=1 FL=1|nr:LysR family transcriptional regulator [Syntrophales bacterium]HPQ45413.1 LysR family transcriptional regulator [Syntrophales bacterium]
MELYQLKTFLAVAAEQHLTRAAERLHISQPSVSTHIKTLEEELGLTLFIRTPKGMILTHDGNLIKLKVEVALQTIEAIHHQADQLNNNVARTIRIGLNIDAQYIRAADLLTVLHRKFPRLELHYFQRHSLEAHDEVQTGQLDAAFVFEGSTHSSLEARWLARFGIVIVAPYEWESRLRNVDLVGLTEFPWIWTDDRCPFNRIIHRLFEPLNRVPEKKVVVDHDTTIRKMVAAEAGLCLMVESEAIDAAKQNQILILGDRVTELDLFLIHMKKRSNEPLIKGLVEATCGVWLSDRKGDVGDGRSFALKSEKGFLENG